MEKIDLHKYMDSYRELEKSLSNTVRISHSEVFILVVKDLIDKRNSCKGDTQKSFDIVLWYYLGDEDFKKHVIDGEPITD